MKLTAAELASVRAQGLYVTEKCNDCGRLLNRTVRYTITGRPEAYCSAVCRGAVFFGDRYTAKKRSSPGRCGSAVACSTGRKEGRSFVTTLVEKNSRGRMSPHRRRNVKNRGHRLN
jgi:hypothetical protein